MKTALITGATGLIGNHLLQLLLDSTNYSSVIALSRKPLPAHAKLTVIQTDLQHLDEYGASLKADDVFCCLGTTMAKAKTKEKFREADFDYPLAIATIMHANGATQFFLVSALGADKHSRIFYNKVKGEIEEAISRIGFRTVHIFRPSLLLGHREEKRSGEDAAKVVYKVFGFLIPEKYKGIEGLKVAQAMLAYAAKQEPGIFIHESRDLRNENLNLVSR